jgi:carbonic anhydrase
MAHTCKALIVTCMDFRFQSALVNFAKEQGLENSYDLFSIAGTQQTFINSETQFVALKQVELSQKLHGMTEVYLIAHWDCGAYGGSKAFESVEKQKAQYEGDLEVAKKIIIEKFPTVIVHKFLAHLDGDKISYEKIG